MPRNLNFKAIMDNATTTIFKKNSFLEIRSFRISLNNVQLAFDSYTLIHTLLFGVNTTMRSGMLNKCKTVAIKFLQDVTVIYL